MANLEQLITPARLKDLADSLEKLLEPGSPMPWSNWPNTRSSGWIRRWHRSTTPMARSVESCLAGWVAPSGLCPGRVRSRCLGGEDHVLIVDIGPAESVAPKVRSLGKAFEPIERKATVV